LPRARDQTYAQRVNYSANGGGLNGSVVLNAMGGMGPLSEDMLARLQKDAMNRKQVTMTGWVMDLQTFFLGGILGNTNPRLIGQPISANGNVNTGNIPVVNQRNVRQNGDPNVAGQNQIPPVPPTGNVANSPQAVPNALATNNNNGIANNQTGNVANPPQGVPNTLATNNNNVITNNQNGSAFSDFGQLMVLRTNSGALLLTQDPLARTSVQLSVTGKAVTLQGRIYNREGMKLMLVSAVNEPNGSVTGSGNSSGTNSNNTGPTNNSNNNQTGSETNRSTR